MKKITLNSGGVGSRQGEMLEGYYGKLGKGGGGSD